MSDEQQRDSQDDDPLWDEDGTEDVYDPSEDPNVCPDCGGDLTCIDLVCCCNDIECGYCVDYKVDSDEDDEDDEPDEGVFPDPEWIDHEAAGSGGESK